MRRLTWPRVGPVVPPVVAPMFEYARFGHQSLTNGVLGWGQANTAFFYPVWFPDPWTATKLWWQNGTTITGNIDCGIYDEEGNRLVSTGSTAQSGASSIQSVDITDTPLPAGLLYFALVASSISTSFWGMSTTTSLRGETLGVYIQTSALPLPATATFAAILGSGLGANIYKFGALKAPRTVL